MILISVPSSALAKYGLHEKSTDQEWLEAISGRVWNLGAKAGTETILGILTGERVGEAADLVALASIKVEDGGRITLTREPMSLEREARSEVRNLRVKLTRNPVSYLDLGENWHGCGCGCGVLVRPQVSFANGHDQKAIHERINRYFGGDVMKALAELDRVFGPEGNQER